MCGSFVNAGNELNVKAGRIRCIEIL